MARTRKRPRRTPPATPRADLSDWQGFRARRHSPRLRWLVIAAVVAGVSTILVAQLKAFVGEGFFHAWMFSLLALQVVVVVESDRHLRGWTRRAAPVASAFATAGFVALALGAGMTAAFALCAAMLAVAFMPPSWHGWLLDATSVGGA
jgi:hypothetical protein